MSAQPEASQIRSIVGRIEHLDSRIEYVRERLALCCGLDQRTTSRAFNIASRLLGLPYETGRIACCALLLGDRSLASVGNGPPNLSLVGFVYEAEPVAAPGIYKVGFSRAPETRVRQLESIVRLPLRLVASEPGTMLDEHVRHCQLREFRMHGEWFARKAEASSGEAA